MKSTSHGKALAINNIPDYIVTKKFTDGIAEILKKTPEFKNYFDDNSQESHNTMLYIFSITLTDLFNKWFQEGLIPKEHATAKIMFLFKESPNPQTTID